MRQIISLIIIFNVLSTYVYGNIKYFNNDNADIIIDIQKDKITFFAFGGSSDGRSEDFAVNSVVKQKENGQYIGNIQDLYLNEIFNYIVDRPNRKINFEIKDSILKVTEFDVFGIAPLSSIFLGTYKLGKIIPDYLTDIFQECEMNQNNILYPIRSQICNIKENLKVIRPSRQYLYNSNNKDSQTKMYIIKGDKVEILKEEDAWYYILYKGKREIKKWIPKTAVE